MTHEINIYGDIVPFKWWGDGEYDMTDLNNSLSGISPADGDDMLVNIHTFGGCTTTAFAMYNKLLNFQKKHNLPITTRVDGYCASSGVILLLAGEKRIGNQYAEPFIHNAWTWTMGDKNEHQKHFENLTRVDNQIATLYAERANINKEKALELMAAEDFVTPEDALAFGFYTELENVYAAENTFVFNSLRNENLKNRQNFNNNMSDKNRKSTWNKLKSDIDAFFGGAKNKIVFTADNAELDFYELDSDATPAVGDKAKFDGKAAGESNDGKYVMPNGETYNFTGEELTEIVPKTEEGDNDDLEAENAALREEVQNLKTKNATLITEKEGINNKLKDAEKILKNLKDLEAEDDADNSEIPRNSKSEPKTRNLFKNIK